MLTWLEPQQEKKKPDNDPKSGRPAANSARGNPFSNGQDSSAFLFGCDFLLTSYRSWSFSALCFETILILLC
jgi:hypothetical protein